MAGRQRDRRVQRPVESDLPGWPGQREPDYRPGVGARRADPQFDLATSRVARALP